MRQRERRKGHWTSALLVRRPIFNHPGICFPLSPAFIFLGIKRSVRGIIARDLLNFCPTLTPPDVTYDAPSYPQLDTALCNQDCRDSLSWICWPRYKDKSTHLPLTSGTLWPTQFQPQGKRERVTKNSPEKATWVCHTRPPVLSCPSIFCTRVCEQRCLVIADQTQPTFCHLYFYYCGWKGNMLPFGPFDLICNPLEKLQWTFSCWARRKFR